MFGNKFYWISKFLSYFEGTILTFIGFFIFFNKKFKKHPYPLIAYSTLLIGMDYFDQASLLCVYQLPQFTAGYLKILTNLLDGKIYGYHTSFTIEITYEEIYKTSQYFIKF
jgi:hypothetical protein